eukprot:6378172-Prymnesium_polylepis.1
MCLPHCLLIVCRCLPQVGTPADCCTMADGRFLGGPQAKLRAKLTEKARHRPYELLRPRMPAGTKVQRAGGGAEAGRFEPQGRDGSAGAAVRGEYSEHVEYVREPPSRRRHAREAR